MVIWLAQTLLSCAKFRPLRVRKKEEKKRRKKDIILLTLDWLWGRPQALLQRRNVWSVRVGLANGAKQTPSQNWGTYFQSCMYPTDSAWPAFLMPFLLLLPVSGNLSRGFTVTQTKRAYSALHPQALTECSPLNFRMQNQHTRELALEIRNTSTTIKTWVAYGNSHLAYV